MDNKKYEWRKVFHRWIWNGKIPIQEFIKTIQPEDDVKIGKEEVFVHQLSKYEKRDFIKIYRKFEIE